MITAEPGETHPTLAEVKAQVPELEEAAQAGELGRLFGEMAPNLDETGKKLLLQIVNSINWAKLSQ